LIARWRDYWAARGREPLGRGHLLWHPPLAARGVPARELLVYLPPGYDASARRYPTFYFLDGQNLFDEATSYAGAWNAQEIFDALADRGLPAIAVAVPNAGRRRIFEYGPWSDETYGGGGGERFLAFLAGGVRPRVADSFAVDPAPAATALAGVSMGGLFALWGMFRRPAAFGAAIAMSPTLFFAGLAIFDWLAERPFAGGRIYLDVGTLEGRRPRRRPAPAPRHPSGAMKRLRRLRRLLVKKGYREGIDLRLVEEAGARHEEAAWRRRLPGAVEFLLAPAAAEPGARRGRLKG
jgi:predicted alpha/beta superfamily hydrolase